MSDGPAFATAMEAAFKQIMDGINYGNAATARHAPWTPTVASTQTATGWEYAIDLAGYNQEQVTVAFEAGSIVIDGTASDGASSGVAHVGPFHVSVRLAPGNVQDDVTWNLHHGVLTIDVKTPTEHVIRQHTADPGDPKAKEDQTPPGR